MQELATVRQSAIAPIQVFNFDYFNEFINYCDASPKTVQTYTRAIRQFSNWLIFNGINQPTRADVINYRDELKANGKKPTTVQAYIMALKQFFNFTEVMGIYPNITLHLKGARIDVGHKKDNLTKNQVKMLLSSIDTSTLKGKRDYAIMGLMVTAGLRTIEVVRANVEDLGLVGSQSVLYVQGKGHEEKTDFVNLAYEVEQAIREYLKARGVKENTEPLFTSTSNNNAGGRVTTKTISTLVKDQLKSIGLDSDRLTAHSLRHTAITTAVEQGLDLHEAQEFARHRNPATTEIYIHKQDKVKNRGSKLVASAFFN